MTTSWAVRVVDHDPASSAGAPVSEVGVGVGDAVGEGEGVGVAVCDSVAVGEAVAECGALGEGAGVAGVGAVQASPASMTAPTATSRRRCREATSMRDNVAHSSFASLRSLCSGGWLFVSRSYRF